MKNTLEKIVASDSEELKNLIDKKLSYFHACLSGLKEDIYIAKGGKRLVEAIDYEAAKKLLPNIDKLTKENSYKIIPLKKEACLPFLVKDNIYTFRYQNGSEVLKYSTLGCGSYVTRFGKLVLKASDYDFVRTPRVNDILLPSDIKVDFDISEIYRQTLFTYRYSMRDICNVLIKALKDLEELAKSFIKKYGKQEKLLQAVDKVVLGRVIANLRKVLEFTAVEGIFQGAIMFPTIPEGEEGEAILEQSLDAFREPGVIPRRVDDTVYGFVVGIREPAELLWRWTRLITNCLAAANAGYLLKLFKDFENRVKHVQKVVTC